MRRLLFVVLIGTVLVVGPTCRGKGGDEDADGDGDVDSGADGDADTDVDTDADTDIDTDADVDGDGDADGDTDADADEDPDAVLVWTLDGVEVARSFGAEVAGGTSAYLFLPYWGRNVQAILGDYGSLVPGIYDCDDYTTGPVNVSLITSDNSWAGLEDLPEEWKTLIIAYCDAAGTYPDAIDMWLRLDTVGARLVGQYQATIIGGGPRAGHTLVIDGTFDVAVP